jgi:hypothetical protein
MCCVMPWMVTLLSVGLIGVPHDVQMGCSMTPQYRPAATRRQWTKV